MLYRTAKRLLPAALAATIALPAAGQDTVMYRGGYTDGYSLQGQNSYVPVPKDHYTLYRGGYSDGYGAFAYTSYTPDGLDHQVLYRGGASDGYGGSGQDNFAPTFLDHFAAYTTDTNSRGEGYGFWEDHDYDPAFKDHFMAYTSSGTNDGYAGSLVVTQVPLPLDLLSFKGNAVNGSYSLLQWIVARERGIAYYELQRGKDGRSFTAIYDHKAANGPVQEVAYDYKDYEPFEGANYYRLKIVDQNGKAEYSNIVLILFRRERPALAVFPNPASHSVTIVYPFGKEARLVVRDARGVAVKNTVLPGGAGQAVLQVDDLPAGLYWMQIGTPGASPEVIRFVKQ